MKNEKSQLQFLDYKIEKIDYKMNRNFDFNMIHSNIGMAQHFTREIQVISKDEFLLKLEVEIEGEKKNIAPFELTVSILGHFHFDKWQDNEDSIKMVKFNAPAILFPYLRSIITNITATANITPYILPTFNMYDLFCENEK